MIDSSIDGILLDIEGTTSSISFVYDVMFPFAREHFATYLEAKWDCQKLQSAISILTEEASSSTVDPLDLTASALLTQHNTPTQHRQAIVDRLLRLMDDDVKATGLKQIQGLVWQQGFTSGQMIAHVYDDVRPAIESWNAAGKDVRIYSSGSVHAQKLFFEHSVSGNMLPLFGGHYDTTSGPKKETLSYQKIADQFGLSAEKILFVSDIAAELDAANGAGMQTVLSIRPGNQPVENADRYDAIESFDQIDVS